MLPVSNGCTSTVGSLPLDQKCLVALIYILQGLQLMSGGLDALENIGKKTMEVLTEGDPGQWEYNYCFDCM